MFHVFHRKKQHNKDDLLNQLNWLRAGVLGANDGIVSTAGLVLGVVGANGSFTAILAAGIAGLVAGALSMAAGEYVSVSTQRDTEKAAVAHEQNELATMPCEELNELTHLIASKGINIGIAHEAAVELSRKNALAAHAELELGIHLNNYANPWQAATASAFSFCLGAIIPLLAVLLAPREQAVIITFLAVVIALILTGYSSAILGKAPVKAATIRNVCGGVLAMVVTFVIGKFVGAFF